VATGSVRSSAARGAIAGAIAGILTCFAGTEYLLDNASIPGISWGIVALVFVVQLAASGAAIGGVVSAGKALLDRRTGKRTSWAPVLASALGTAAVAAPSGAFGAAYFGSLHAPFMGTALIFAIASVIGVSLAVALAWLDQVGDRALANAPRLRRAALCGVGLALPLVGIGGAIAAAAPDHEVLAAFRMAPAGLGALAGAGLGLVFGLYAGLVTGAVRRLGTRGASERSERGIGVAPNAVRVAPREREEPTDREAEIDPLAEEEAELEARFAELDRAEKRARA
jgi:hypothetical protein